MKLLASLIWSTFAILLLLLAFSTCARPGSGKATTSQLTSGQEKSSGAANGTTMDEHRWKDSGVDVAVEEFDEEMQAAGTVLFDPGPLEVFFEALHKLETKNSGVARILHYGDSHTAADFLTTTIRRRFQNRFGDAGRGFVLLGRPWRSYRPADVYLDASDNWQSERIFIAAKPGTLDGRYGLGGVTTQTDESGEYAAWGTSNETGYNNLATSFEVFYLKQPDGGSFDLFVDGQLKDTIQTAASEFSSGFKRIEEAAGPHRVKIKSNGDGEVRLFGGVVENNGPGIVYDQLGINGAFFSTPLRWDESLLEEQVRRRAPNMIVLMYGTNGAGSKKMISPVAYANNMRQTVARLKRGSPGAACLLIGPPDRRRVLDVSSETTHLDWIVEVQADTAEILDCAFINTRELMGGEGSHILWQSKNLAQPDGVHLTVKGYRLLGQMIWTKIIDAYEEYSSETAETEVFE